MKRAWAAALSQQYLCSMYNIQENNLRLMLHFQHMASKLAIVFSICLQEEEETWQHISLLLTFHWNDLSYMATSYFKEAWETWSSSVLRKKEKASFRSPGTSVYPICYFPPAPLPPCFSFLSWIAIPLNLSSLLHHLYFSPLCPITAVQTSFNLDS